MDLTHPEEREQNSPTPSSDSDLVITPPLGLETLLLALTAVTLLLPVAVVRHSFIQRPDVL